MWILKFQGNIVSAKQGPLIIYKNIEVDAKES